MLQEIGPKQYHVEFQEKLPAEGDFCFVFQDKAILERVENGPAVLPTFGELKENVVRTMYLFAIDQDAYYLTVLKENFLPEGYVYREFRKDRETKEQALHFAETVAYQLSVWYRDNRCCGRCGAETVPEKDERVLRCPKCGNMIYPKIAPAIIVALTDGDRLLLTRYNGRAYKGFALIAGFTEIGETAEDTVHREVMEEVGLQVKDIRYYASQPWGSDSNLLLGFFAKLDGSSQIHMDKQELSQAAWYRREEISVKPDGYSLTNDMIQAFLRGES